MSKVEGGLQELEESGYRLELLTDSGIAYSQTTGELMAETEELIKVFVTIVKNVKANGR